MEQTTGTHWKKNFNYNYLGAYSLTAGKDMIVTIKDTKIEMVKNQKGENEQCFTCYFVESPKPMILNKTNCKAIEKLYGTPMIEEWVGKKVQLYSAMIRAFGTETDCLRIRDFKPEAQKIDNAEALKLISSSKSFSELQANYTSLSKELKADKDVMAEKERLKISFAK